MIRGLFGALDVVPDLEVDVIAGRPTSATIWKICGWFAENLPWSAVGIVAAALVVIGLIVGLLVRRRVRSVPE